MAEPREKQINEGLRRSGILADAVRPVVLAHSQALLAEGLPFSEAQTVLITALMYELASAIASGPARHHRGQLRILAEEMPRLVREAAVAQRRVVPETGA